MFYVTLDNHFYRAKPNRAEVGAITNRLKMAGPTCCSEAELCEHVRRGGTFVCGTYEPQRNSWGEFAGQQLAAIDIDNKDDTCELRPGDNGYLDPLDALDRCNRLGLSPLCLYFTFSCRPDHYRYRLVFDYGERLGNKIMAETAVRTLLDLFPEADKACKNANRLFFGSNGEVWEAWQVWDSERTNIDVLRGHFRGLAAKTEAPEWVRAITRSRPEPGAGAAPAGPASPASGACFVGRGDPEIKDMCAQVDLLELVRQDTGETGHRTGGGVQFHKCTVCGHRDDLTVWQDNSYTCFSGSCPWPRNASGNHGGDVLTYLRYAHHDGDLIAAVRELRELTGNPYKRKEEHCQT